MSELILTFDYELFGDGAGNVFTHMIDPTDKILKHCGEYNVKVTIFVEIIEYLKLKEAWGNGNFMGYDKNPAKAIETQIQNAALDGHDIQLHIHPQWVNAEFIDKVWNIDFDNWRLGDFSGKDGYNIKNLLHDAKVELEKIVQQVKPEYKCMALRAGGYNIMPSKEVFSAMKDLGLKIDTSIYPGGYEDSSLSRYDYRYVSANLEYWWADHEDIRLISRLKKEIIEFPIFAMPVNRWKRILTVSKIKSLIAKKKHNISALTKEKVSNKGFFSKISYLFDKEMATWDVCIFSKKLHQSFLNAIEKKMSLYEKRSCFVLIGHPKSLQDDLDFKSFLKAVKARDKRYVFKTLIEKYYEIVFS